MSSEAVQPGLCLIKEVTHILQSKRLMQLKKLLKTVTNSFFYCIWKSICVLSVFVDCLERY